MHISACCPSCGICYQLETTMRGKRMRCPNQSCRAIFEVCAEAELAPPAPLDAPSPLTAPPRQVSGSVADLVPLLTAQPASAPAEETAPQARMKPGAQPKPARDVPPLKRPTPTVEAPPTVAAAAPPTESPPPALDWGPLSESFGEMDATAFAPVDGSAAGKGASEAGVKSWQPPPVRVPGLAQADSVPTTSSTPPLAAPQLPTPQSGRRRLWKALGAMVLVLFALGAAALWQYQRQMAGNEIQRLELASERYKDHNFEDAAARYRNLQRDYPKSPNQALYRFAAELSGLREPVYRVQYDAEELKNALLRLTEFVAGSRDDPLLEPYHGDLWNTFTKLSEKLSETAEEKHERALAALAEKALEQATAFKAPADTPAHTRIQLIRDHLATVNRVIDLWERKQAVLAQVQRVLDHFTFDRRQEALRAATQAGVSADPDVARLLAELPAKHRASVSYQPTPPAKTVLPQEDVEPSLLVAPLLRARLGDKADDARLVLAVVRGVLYAFEPVHGDVRWARRVSIDSQAMPLILPRTTITPELVVALTPDSFTLTALDAARGTPVWHHRLKAACLGNPVRLGNRLFVATDLGYVEEIETTEGTSLGYYSLGQPLPVGGVHQPGTNLLYFPADSETVYILDVAARTCAGILYSGHPAGSLRSAPVIIPEAGLSGDSKRAARGCLVLSQEDGLENIRLRVFPLPIPASGPTPKPWEKSLRGWSWFPPYADSERLAQVTDAGQFALFGVGPRFGDAVNLFPIGKEETILGSGLSGSGRALIAHADAERFWVLADGELHKLVLTFDRQEGPKLVQRPLAEPGLGFPLHAGQVRTEADGSTILFLVTQARDGQTCLASALEGRRGTIAWQRQVGLLCRGQPMRLGDRMVVEDQSGSLYLFSEGEIKNMSGAAWRQAGRKLPSAANSAGRSTFLPAPDGASVFVITPLATQPPGVMVHHFQSGKDAPLTSIFPLQAPLTGTPGVGSDALVLPLGNGVLVRQALAGGPAVSGPNWRAAHAEPESVGYVAPLGKEDFLVTDGSRGLRRLHWPAGDMAQTKASAELSYRILAAPQVLPPNPATGEARIFVADAGNTVSLLAGDSLEIVRQWPMGGKITAGPFVRGQGVGCIVDHRRLVWLNPEKEGVAWAYGPFAADVVGEPQMALDNLLIVADVSGHFTGFDLRSGQVQGTGYTLRANVAPAAAPVAFGAGRLFAPLTDGTVLLLSLRHFMHPLQGMPVVWP